jgi:hypothetical protein
MGMHPHLTTALAGGALLVGCGQQPPVTVQTVPRTQRDVVVGSTVIVRGDYAPDEHGPFTFDGRYDVRFTQRGTGVDFTKEVPFTARLERSVAGRAGRRIPLFEAAARSGRTTISARGRFQVVVDYGDSPYEIRFARTGR